MKSEEINDMVRDRLTRLHLFRGPVDAFLGGETGAGHPTTEEVILDVLMLQLTVLTDIACRLAQGSEEVDAKFSPWPRRSV